MNKQFICIKCNKEFENQYDIEVRIHKLENGKDHSIRSKEII